MAWELIEEGGDGAATMSAVARRAGLTRQAVYFHFPDRTALLVALTRHVDDHRDLEAWVERIESASGGEAMLRRFAEMQAARNPTFAAVARAIEGARHRDESAAAAWRQQTDDRLDACRDLLVPALRADGLVHPAWDDEEAVLLVWELTSFRVWDDLVGEAGLPAPRYVELITATALGALARATG